MKIIKQKTFLLFMGWMILLLFITPVSAKGAKDSTKYSSKEFLNITRRARPAKTWAILSGSIVNKRRGASKVHQAEIKVGMRFTDERILAKIFIKENNKGNEESYTVGQSYDGAQASIIASNPDSNNPLLGEFGLRPEDLIMSFLYWKLKRELKNDSVKGLDCRVLELTNPKSNEMVKVSISSEYFYPLKVEWYKPDHTTPYRNVVISSFKTEGNLGSPSELELYGPGWRTRIDFSNIRLGYTKDGIPKDIFKK